MDISLQGGLIQEPADQDGENIDYTPVVKRFDTATRPQHRVRGTTPIPDVSKQSEFFLALEALKDTIAGKLESIGEHGFALPLRKCRTEKYVKLCTDCRRATTYMNRCEVRYCPCCAPRLARERRRSLEWWTDKIDQAKHVVLTARNTDDLTPERVKFIKSAFSKLRRLAQAKAWTGGFYSLECTNEGRGWHLHIHALIQAKWIDAAWLSRAWARLIGQDFAIVKVKDARNRQYLGELCKYIVKGDQLATWTPQQIAQFVRAFDGQRTFGVFGKLYAERKLHREFLDSIQKETEPCPCGCTTFRFLDQNEWEWYECTNGPNLRQIAQTPETQNAELPLTL